ncbi:unnamed protein product [Clonostachys rhizophaga]|uniref:Zn(2)-C6 fungal-type domain-containing protein n=1 Tax=Clonostachys rhizophaga TaxID=160324 RepID=A0A9N9YIS1_9HYPO|nr:unnamed protein product [Clonostachys rhizophaga]
MVNHGASKGCLTCKQRRVKCDEGKPGCQRCFRRGRECGGYEKPPTTLKFKPQTFSYTRPGRRAHIIDKANSAKESRDSSPPISRTPSPPVVNCALAFFLGNFAGKGRGFASSRGFFELLAPALAKEPQDSPLTLALCALSTKVLKQWKEDPYSFNKPHRRLAHAYARLRTAIADPNESRTQSTVLAALVFQFHENLSAVFSMQKAQRTHHDGAVALMNQHGTELLSTPYGRHMVRYLMFVEIAAAIREKRPFPTSVLSIPEIANTPGNPSAALDLIGVAVANVQHRVTSFAERLALEPLLERDLEPILMQLDNIHIRLLDWRNTLFKAWNPIYVSNVRETNPPIISYQGDCDIYPDVQISSIWSNWRSYRIVLFKAALILLRQLPKISPRVVQVAYGEPQDIQDLEQTTRQSIQETFDAMCRVVPFCMGNRTRTASMHDMVAVDLHFPSYHDPGTCDPSALEQWPRDEILSLANHLGHIKALGAWHALTPLSFMLSVCNDEYGSLVAESLRQGQLQWIRKELARSVLVLSMRKSAPNSPTSAQSSPPGQYGTTGTTPTEEPGRSGAGYPDDNDTLYKMSADEVEQLRGSLRLSGGA